MTRKCRTPASLCIILVLAACSPSDTSEQGLKVAAYELNQWSLGLSVLGSLGTVIALVFGFRQYRRAEKWKRAEFLAKEMKEFFGDEKIRTALLLSDWGTRHIRLMALSSPADTSVTRVTRPMQVAALLPHSIVDETLGSDTEGSSEEGETFGETDAALAAVKPRMRRFTREQAVIRDCYDAYLDGLERFASYLSTGLVTVQDLQPYLGYWLKDLAYPTTDVNDATWAACVITYVHFYGYTGVATLFDAFGYDIGATSDVYLGFIAQIQDRTLATKLSATVNPVRIASDPDDNSERAA